MLQTLHRLFFLISFFLIRLINIQFNFTVQTFQLPAGTKGLNTWEQLGCRSINQGDPGVSIPAVLCCPEAKKQLGFSLFFPNPLSFSDWQRWQPCRDKERCRGCAVGAAGMGTTRMLRWHGGRMGIATGSPLQTPLTPSPGEFRAQTQISSITSTEVFSWPNTCGATKTHFTISRGRQAV